MNNEKEISESLTNKDAEHLAKVFGKSDRILIKKLANNDRDWARNPDKHQYGPYIPKEQRDGGFFKSLEVKPREGNEIRETFFRTIWPQVEGREKRTRLVHYTSKGQETQMTGVPKELFADLSPASYIVMGRTSSGSDFTYECLTIDSCSDEAIFLRDLFNLSPDFLVGEFEPEIVKIAERERVLDFADQVIHAWQNGRIAEFANDNASMPLTIELARMAQAEFLKKKNLPSINPFVITAPGDALREISRDIEWNLFREYQRRERSVELVRIILGDQPGPINPKDIIRRLIDEFLKIDALMLSASQQRKSRAGYSYEHHIEALLISGGIPFEKQVVIESKKRPDFILPSLKYLNSNSEDAATALILSAKTTLRERWKQVEREMKGKRLFLTTVDENIAGNAIEDMASIGIQLVIPESLMESKATEYAGHKNVISFKQFCEVKLKPHIKTWTS